MEQGGDVSFGGGREMEDIPTSLENLIMDRVHGLGAIRSGCFRRPPC